MLTPSSEAKAAHVQRHIAAPQSSPVAAPLVLWRICSGEWLICQDNGGLKIALRSLFVTAEIYGAALLLNAATKPGALWFTFDVKQAGSLVNKTIPWLGAILGSTYLAFYSRFASQWAYLCGVYNSIMAAEAMQEGKPKPLAEWKRAFCEECKLLHLAHKEPFRGRIQEWHKTTLSQRPPPSSRSFRQAS